MKKAAFLLILGLAIITLGSTANASITDVIEYDQYYFVENPTYTYSSPYYRWYNEDWSWSHNAITSTTTPTSVSLSISAWDVDLSSGEIDNIYAYNSGTRTLLGSLDGADDSWEWTTFDLDDTWYDDIEDGLVVEIDIDSANTSKHWAVTLAKSILLIDGGTLPDPTPGTPNNTVPEPATMALFGTGLVGMALRKRKQA